MLQKSVKQWRDDYAKQLSIAEKKITPKIKKYYQKEYFKGVDNFIETGNPDYQSLFKFDFFKQIYIDIYESVSMQFAKWYAKNYEKYEVKAQNTDQYISIWRAAFSFYASQVAATNVVLVSNTAKQTLIRITQRLYSDPDFVSLGADERARILRNQFSKYSR